MKHISAISFLCPECGKDITIHSGVLGEDYKLYFIAYCDNCHDSYPFPMDKVVNALCQGVKVVHSGSKLVN